MPFQEVSKMQQRQKLAYLVLEEGLSVSDAAQLFGVSRPTARLWVQRARAAGIANLQEQSRRPQLIPHRTDPALERRILEVKSRHPSYGAKKIVHLLWGDAPPVCVRTADRILKRHGLVTPRARAQKTGKRFEMSCCNEMWQMDFKGLGSPRHWYSPLTILDDHSRFCLAFEPLESHSSRLIWDALWGIMGEYGLPDAILTDNEPCFARTLVCGPSFLESRLWLLGIRTLQCRPLHPQTIGKVERFHRTAEEWLKERLRQPDIKSAQEVYAEFLKAYNWERPHEALSMRVPGSLYSPSHRSRPKKMPKHEIPEGSIARKVNAAGVFTLRSKEYRVGKGLAGEYVEIREEENNYGVYFANVKIAQIPLLRV